MCLLCKRCPKCAEAAVDSDGKEGMGMRKGEISLTKDIIDVLVSLIGPEVVWKIGVSVEWTMHERWIALIRNAKFWPFWHSSSAWGNCSPNGWSKILRRTWNLNIQILSRFVLSKTSWKQINKSFFEKLRSRWALSLDRHEELASMPRYCVHADTWYTP